ncbi:hypothetical protein BN77_1974 [Rhizobium mesoamericanum STM3625]|uniref:Uncharacterized protein n=1 Tax=Rhizobium mesoamericanum STM3625 TaxID=1211777 RepID=K0PY37_9HYPH|nr:hypothetical protein BN77_1974 [Rhizobium mesoamericanum STM3625]
MKRCCATPDQARSQPFPDGTAAFPYEHNGATFAGVYKDLKSPFGITPYHTAAIASAWPRHFE